MSYLFCSIIHTNPRCHTKATKGLPTSMDTFTSYTYPDPKESTPSVLTPTEKSYLFRRNFLRLTQITMMTGWLLFILAILVFFVWMAYSLADDSNALITFGIAGIICSGIKSKNKLGIKLKVSKV